MGIAFQKSRRHASPLLVVGAVAIGLVSAITIYRFSIANAQSVGDFSDSSASTTEVLNDQTEVKTDMTHDTNTDMQDQTDEGSQSQTSYSSSSVHTSQGSVTVNGKTYDMPQNGQIHETQVSPDGQTRTDISIQSSGSGNSYSSSSNVNVHSNSSSSVVNNSWSSSQ